MVDVSAYINSFINFEKIPRYKYAASFKLERMIAFLDELGNPHKNLNVIHVAGSKGKGSTCAIAAHILKDAGYKVGLYTSPHLIDIRERIRILSKNAKRNQRVSGGFEGVISQKEFIGLVKKIKPAAEKFREHKKFGRISFFEILTACAFLYFKQKKIDVAVLETGMGGRLDATNVIDALVCGITNISLEHTDKLGGTLAKIAYEKAGIIKRQRPKFKNYTLEAVTARQKKEVIRVIKKVCAEKGAELREVGKDLKYFIKISNEKSQVFDLKSREFFYKNLELSLIGAHQVENASLAIGMIEAVRKKFNIKENNIRNGLKNAVWPGRLQVIWKNPDIVLDGAQNPASMSALISSVKKIFKYKKLICVFGISNDKDIKGVSSILSEVCDIIILTEAKNNIRAEKVERLKDYFKRPAIKEIKNLDKALDSAIKAADKEDIILITGSLFVVGGALNYFKNKGGIVEGIG